MVDISRPWIVDTPLSERWPVYTRANVGEVSPNVTTPLMWSMIGGPPAEREWKQALVEFGAFDIDEFRPDVIDIQGLVHGYVYLNLSNMRTFGARMPGATPDLMDRTYLGDRQAPAFQDRGRPFPGGTGAPRRGGAAGDRSGTGLPGGGHLRDLLSCEDDAEP